MTQEGNNKNYVNMVDNTSQKKEDNQHRVDPGKVTIHIMPKRYMSSVPTAKKAKNTGVLILIFGFLFLIVALMVLFSFLKKSPTVQSIESQSQENKKTPVVNKTKPSGKINNKKIQEQKEQATTSLTDIRNNQDDTKASSTDEKKVLRIDAGSQKSSPYVKAIDSDKDGLSDLEEILFGSSPNSNDTDGDGYPDQTEVLSLHDPASRGNLIDSLNIEKYNNEDYDFSILVPALLQVDTVSGQDSLIINLKGEGQYIQIISQEIVNQQTLDDWYKETFEVEEVPDNQIYKRGSWNGIINESKLTIYLEHPNKKYIITLNYEMGDNNTLYYKNVFDMMLRSISAIE